MTDTHVRAIRLNDEPGAACVVSGPVKDGRFYQMTVLNGDKATSCLLTPEQMCEMWLFVRTQWKP